MIEFSWEDPVFVTSPESMNASVVLNLHILLFHFHYVFTLNKEAISLENLNLIVKMERKTKMSTVISKIIAD